MVFGLSFRTGSEQEAGRHFLVCFFIGSHISFLPVSFSNNNVGKHIGEQFTNC